ncbi:MAG: N-acetylmuramoyl-L-alanine amidase [Ferruginibacter sp.]
MPGKKLFFIFSFFVFQFTFCNAVFSQTPKRIKTIIVDAGHGGSDNGATGQYENSLRSKEKDVTLAISMKLVAELKKQLPDIKVVPTRTTDVFDDVREKAKIANENKGDLFLCIHADSGPLKTGRRKIGSHTVTRYKVTYKGKGKKKKKISTPYSVVEPIYEYFKLPLTRNGTSVWIFAAHKTSDKLKAIMQEEGDFEVEDGSNTDSSFTPIDYTSAVGRNIAQIYAQRYQVKSDRIATMVNDEIEKTGRPALGVNQRQKGIWVLQATNMPAILVETGFINNPEDEKYLNSDKGQQELAEAITQAVIRYKEWTENPHPATN